VGEDGQQQLETWRDRVDAWRGDRRVVAAVLACVAVAAAIAWWRAGAAAAPPAAPPPRAAPSSTIAHFGTTTTRPDRLIVDVVGAVRAPGIVRVGARARVVDAIAAAGGATADADLERLNLAAPLSDGARVAVPAVGRPPPALDPNATSGTPAATGAVGASGVASAPVNINTATAEELDKLPGIGPATAAAIVSDRSAHGPFASVDDLQRVRGIGPSKLAQLRDLVTV
jgi:competence protein ComEA